MLAYGAVNFAQDAWNEQVVKRGWTDAGIPSALLPGREADLAVVVALAVAATLRAAPRGQATSYSAP